MKTNEANISAHSDYYLYTPSKTAQHIFFYPLQCGTFSYLPGYILNRTKLDSFLLMYIHKGAMDIDINGQKFSASSGHFVFINCYEPHGYATQKGADCIWIHFDSSLARAYYDLITSKLGYVFSIKDDLTILRKMSLIIHTFADKKPVKEPLLSKYLTDILCELMIQSPENSHASNNTSTIERVITYINDHFFEDLSNETLAQIAGLSEYYFIRVFKQETGYTPHEYLLHRRMASARYLLKYTQLTIKEICFDIGFTSESIFCYTFKKYHQMTPKQYRYSNR